MFVCTFLFNSSIEFINVGVFLTRLPLPPPPQVPHILHYSPHKLFSYGFLYFLKGTVLAYPRVFWATFLYVCGAVLYAMGICDATQLSDRGLPCGVGVTDGMNADCHSQFGEVCFINMSIRRVAQRPLTLRTLWHCRVL